MKTKTFPITCSHMRVLIIERAINSLAPELLLRVDEHLSKCDLCKNSCNGLAFATAMNGGTPRFFPLNVIPSGSSDVKSKPVVDVSCKTIPKHIVDRMLGALPKATLKKVESHLAACPGCNSKANLLAEATKGYSGNTVA